MKHQYGDFMAYLYHVGGEPTVWTFCFQFIYFFFGKDLETVDEEKGTLIELIIM